MLPIVRAALALGVMFGMGTALAAPQVKPPGKPAPPVKEKPAPPSPQKPAPTTPSKPAAPKPAPKTLPETTKLQNELAATKQRLQPTITRVQRALTTTQSARAKVRTAIAVVKRIGQIDDALKRIISQLTPIAKLPPTRSVDPLVDALTLVRKQVHPVRVKADAANKKVLTPADKKLATVETGLSQAVSGLKDGTAKIDAAKAHATKLREMVAAHGDPPAEVSALESLAAAVRPTLSPVNAGLQALDDAGGTIEREVDQFADKLAVLANFSPLIEKLWDAVEPVNKSARDLDKTLNERIEIDILGGKIGFTVWQIIEGPGNVADAVLKPLEKLAEDALKPVVKALNLEIKPPKELVALGEALDNLPEPNFPAAAKLDAALADKSIANLQASLTKFLGKKNFP